MRKRDVEQLATLLYERRIRMMRMHCSPHNKEHTLACLSTLVDDLYHTFLCDHFYSVTAQKWKDACESGAPLFLGKEGRNRGN